MPRPRSGRSECAATAALGQGSTSEARSSCRSASSRSSRARASRAGRSSGSAARAQVYKTRASWPAAGGLGPAGQLVPLGRPTERLVAPEQAAGRPRAPARPRPCGAADRRPDRAGRPAGPARRGVPAPCVAVGFKPEPSLERRQTPPAYRPVVRAATPAARAALRCRVLRGRAAAPPRAPRRVGRSRAPT